MNKKILRVISSVAFVACILNTDAQNTWTGKASLTAFNGRLDAAGFSIGHYGFVGTGQTASGFVNDFWRWNQTNNTWDSIAHYPGLGRYGVTAFSIGGKGYCCCGYSGSALAKDLWEYDTTTNSWTQKANFPGAARYGAFVFVIGTKAYIGCGEPNGSPYDQDVYMYNSVTNTWSAVANFPGGERTSLCAFALNGYGYAGAGENGSASFNTVWKYDTGTNVWTSIASIPAPGSGIGGCVSFVLDTTAFVGTGKDLLGSEEHRDFWSYSPTTNSWTSIATLTGVSRWLGVGFSIGERGYAGMGTDSVNAYLQDYWEYTPNMPAAPIANFAANDTSICLGDTVHFTDLSTNSPTSWKWSFENGNPSTSTLQNPTVIYATAGIDSVKLVVKNAGGSDSITVKKCIHVKNCGTGIANISSRNNISLYPNPSNGKFFIQSSVGNGKVLVEIYNILGEEVYSQAGLYNSPATIDMSSQPNGIYLYRVLSETGSLVGEGKLVIQK